MHTISRQEMRRSEDLQVGEFGAESAGDCPSVREVRRASVAWRVLGWHVEPDEDTEWSGTYNRTGEIVVCMIGDDTYFAADPAEFQPLERAAYCGQCGQIGCTDDGLDREAV